jgi:hypothetical protein
MKATSKMPVRVTLDEAVNMINSHNKHEQMIKPVIDIVMHFNGRLTLSIYTHNAYTQRFE